MKKLILVTILLSGCASKPSAPKVILSAKYPCDFFFANSRLSVEKATPERDLACKNGSLGPCEIDPMWNDFTSPPRYEDCLVIAHAELLGGKK